MSAIPTSVVIVSRHRAAALARCVAGLMQQDHPDFEVIVVADPDGLAAVQGIAIKPVLFDAANISAARNAGLAQAAGAVVAFIDDDAVAEPSWLSRLVAPFADRSVVASTGFVRGRNGISFQWRAMEVDQFGQDHPIEVPHQGALRQGIRVRAVKTQGTNCAFRAEALARIGGFDPAYAFFLDEADVNLRLAPLGATAIVPMAEVHHDYAASVRRRADRLPLSLHAIAASTAVFLRRHAPDSDLAAAHGRLRLGESARLARHQAAGRLDRHARSALMDSLDAGWSDGLSRELCTLAARVGTTDFRPLAGTGPRGGQVIAGRFWQKSALMTRARAALAQGDVVTVICLAPTPRAHRLQFVDGVWLQEGGLFGRTERSGPRLRFIRFSRRIVEETRRASLVRPVTGLP